MRIRAIALEEDRLPEMLSGLSREAELQVEKKARVDRDSLRQNFVIPTSALVANLARKQAEALFW